MNTDMQVSPETLFTETEIGRQKRRIENVMRSFFLVMTSLMIIPLLLIIGYLLYKALPVLSLEFLFTNPKDNMRAGGLWAPFLGTIYLVVVSLLVAAPIGVFAAVYLNEYAREGWFTRITNLAVVNLVGVKRHQLCLRGLSFIKLLQKGTFSLII